jgi:RHS repeat-associated protein
MKKQFKLFTKILSVFLTILLVVQIIPQSLISAVAETFSPYEDEFVVDENFEDDEGTAKKELTIIGEDISRRESNVKHYIMSDHSIMAVTYSQPVHYEENGEWVDIDNTLSLEDATDSDDVDGYSNESNDIKVKFAKKADSKKLITIKKDKYSLSWGYESDKKNNKKVDSKIKEKKQNDNQSQYDNYVSGTRSDSIVYENVDENISLEYNIVGNSIKENIIVNAKSDEYTYTFNMKAQNVYLKISEDGSITALSNDTNEVVFVIPAPFMYDAENRMSTDVRYELSEENGHKYKLTVIADTDWINSDETTFPVVIDPYITTEQSRDDIDTTFVASSSNYSSQNLSAMTLLSIGWDTSSYGKTRTLLKFDLPTLNKGDMVIGANLNVAAYHRSFYTTSMEDQQIDAHVITQSWNYTTVTWNNQPSYNSTVYDYDFIKQTDVEGNANWKCFDITKAVKGWYDGDIANNGILIKQHNENGTQATSAACAYFWSEKYNNVKDAYPTIFINYRNNKGIEGYWSYTTAGVEDAGTAYVNDYTGNLVFSTNLAGISSELGSLSVDFVYNGYAAGSKYVPAKGNNVTTSVGQGWMLSLLQTVRKSSLYGLTGDSATTFPYVYTDGDGTEHYFYKKTESGTTTYTDEDGLGLTLTIDEDGTTWIYRITDKDGIKYYFNLVGNLYAINDQSNNALMRATYDSTGKKIQSVKNGSGHTYTFTYSGDYIVKVTDPSSRVTNINYGGVGRVTKITYPDSSYVNYEYDSDACLTKAIASSGYAVEFQYTSAAKAKRVSMMIEKGGTVSSRGTETGQTIGFDRSDYNTTRITTSGTDGEYNSNDDLITTYQFDTYGRTVSQQLKTRDGKDSVAGAYNYSESSESTAFKTANKVTAEAGLGKNVVNLVTGISGETTSGWTSNKSNSTATLSSSSTEQYVGANSLAINISALSSASGNALFYQRISTSKFTPGETYTFSAYVKTTGITKVYDSSLTGAFVQLRAEDSSGTNHNWYSETLLTTDESINDGWRRLTITATIPSNTTGMLVYLGMRNVTGTAYFDCMQLEKGDTANPCNLVENSGFETVSSNMPSKWTANSVSHISGEQGASTANKYDGSYSMRLKGEGNVSKNMKQVIAAYGNKNDTYIVSGWAKADAVSQENHKTAYFEIGVLVSYTATDGSEFNETKTSAKFNTAVSGWQYTVQPFSLASTTKPSATPRNIAIYCKYNFQANYVFFDNIQVIKDVAQSYTYDDEGNVISVSANAEQKSNMEYNGSDLVSYTDAKGYNYTYDYDSAHNLTTATSAKGVVTGFTYNDKNQVTSSELRNKTKSADSSMIIKTDTYYTAESDGIADYAYVAQTLDSHGNPMYYDYNLKKGLLDSVTNANYVTTNYTYKAENDKLLTVSSGDSTVTYSYATNRLNKIIAAATGVNEQFKFEYDAFGNITKTFVGNTALSTNTYGENNGLLTSSAYGNGDVLSYTYDSFGNVTGIKGNSVLRYGWAYNSALTPLLHQDYVNNQKYSYNYDAIGRLIRQEIRTNDSSATHIGSTEFSYDERNNLTSITNEVGGKSVTQKYRYSAVSGLTNSANYAKDNLPTQYYIADSRHADYDYDSLNRLNLRTFTTVRPLYNNYIYWASERNSGSDETYRTTQLKREIIDNTTYDYTYDDVGNITSIMVGERTTADSSSSITAKNKVDYRSYVYDNLNQLTRENNKTSNTTTLFTYDGIGNIKTKKVYGYTTGTVGTLTTNIIYRYGNDGKSGWNNLLTGVDFDGNGSYSSTETITYDAIGNPTSYLGNNLTWFGRQLTGYNSNITYTYDADGYRASKTVNGQTTTYQYVNGMLVYECRPDMEIFYLYDSYNNLTGIRIYNSGSSSATNYYVTTNVQRDVLGIYNANGDKLAGYEYDAWGNVLSVTDANGNPITSETHIANINPFRYRGYYLDQETGLYYLNSRYYDAEVGRFISADTTDILSVQADLYDKNLFAYCDNNPVGRIDVGGDVWETAFDIASLCLSVAELVTNPADPWNWIGVAGDVVDLVPFVTGAGEVTRAIKLSTNVLGKTDEIVEVGCSSYRKLKKGIGSAGVGKEWHHLVEQSQIKKSKVSSNLIQNKLNIISIDKSTHRKISGFYSSRQKKANGLTVRNWLSGKSYQEQFLFGLGVLYRFLYSK